MTSRRFFSFLWIVFLFLTQNMFHYVFPGVVLPFLLAGVIFFALTEGPIFGAVLGCFAGFLLDILGAGKLGGSMALFSLVGILAGFSSTKIFYDSLFTQILLPIFCQYMICAGRVYFFIMKLLLRPSDDFVFGIIQHSKVLMPLRIFFL